jgi:anti-anti-sigma regulatory factor
VKLKLAHESGVEVLQADGPIRSHDAKVLRAGLSKILKTGKNRIVLALSDHADLSLDVIREIAAFDGLARELSGRIVLAGVDEALKTKIESFAKPPVILSFETREAAVAHLRPLAPPAAAAPAPAPPPEAPRHGAHPEAHSFPGHDELAALRMRVAQLESDNARLRERVVRAVIERRVPAHEQDYVDRIQDLEARLERALSEAVPATQVK